MDELNSCGEKMAESFFAKRDKELLEKLRADMSNEENRSTLKSASGIEDETVLQGLVDSGITPEALTAVSLIPLVAVAWADREMNDKEKSAILKAAADAGLTSDSEAYSVLEGWLQSKPEDFLLGTWKTYISSVKRKLDPAATSQLKISVLARSTEVAKAAGGYLGLGSKISDAEQGVLDELTAAFE